MQFNALPLCIAPPKAAEFKMNVELIAKQSQIAPPLPAELFINTQLTDSPRNIAPPLSSQ